MFKLKKIIKNSFGIPLLKDVALGLKALIGFGFAIAASQDTMNLALFSGITAILLGFKGLIVVHGLINIENERESFRKSIERDSS